MITYSIIKKSQLEGAKRLDAEYYQPEYLEVVNKIKSFPTGFKTLRERGVSVVSGPFGSSLKSDAYLDTGVPFLRISDLRDFFVDRSKLVYISEKDNSRLKQSQVFPNDLVLSKVGHTIGIVAVVPEEFKRCNISENNIGIKLKDTSISTDEKNYILVFLNSKFGFSQIFRRISGNAQPKMNIQDVYDIIYPIPDDKIVQEINVSLVEADKSLNQAGILYEQAERLLLEELGLTNFEKNESLNWTITLSDVKAANRIDAEYFQPKYEKLISKITNQNTKLLGDLVSMKKGVETGSEAYQEEGKLFIRVSSLSKNGVENKDQKYLSEELYQKLRKDFEPRAGEILLTKDATPGIAYHVKEPISGVISGGILRLQLKEEIEPEYLALCINSIVGQMQAERDAGGSVIAHWRPEQIKNMQVPILPKIVQQKIAELVRQSHEARKRSKQLLEEAKRKVEEAIEKEV